jgi:nicotinate-nucleotide adenylyltransferase
MQDPLQYGRWINEKREGAKSLRQRLGILGGTFNPVHLAHLILAQSALEMYDLARVLFIPSAQPPHKEDMLIAPAVHRAAMLQLAIEGDLRFEASDIELIRDGPSYSIDTVRALRERHPDSDLYFIIGSDTLLELHSWHKIEELLDLCAFITFERPGTPLGAIPENALRLPAPWPRTLLDSCCGSRQVDISSSDIRHRIQEGLSVRYLVPDSVEMYIAEHNLYLGR